MQGKKNPKTGEFDEISASTLRRWGQKWLKSGMSDPALISGNHARQRKSKINEAVKEIINRIFRSVYVTPEENSKTQVYEEIQIELKNEVAAGRLDPVEASVSESTIRRHIAKFDQFEIDAIRKGQSYAKNKYRYSLSAARLVPMERYEIDHTILDIVVLCPTSGVPLGRPTLTLVIDKASGYPVGAFISFWGTGLATTLSALKVAMTPKQEISAALGLSEQWYGYGIPMSYVVDNGLEFHSPQFMLAAAAMSTEVQFAPIRMGWYKGMVERRLQDLTRRLPAQGRVHKPTSNYLPPNPDKTAAITFDDLCLNIVKCLVTEIPFRPPENRLTRSVDLFREAMETMLPPRMPGNMEDLNLIAAMRVDRTVSHSGVMVEWLRYDSAELSQMRRAAGGTFKTVVKFDPQDLSFVYIQNPISKAWLLVPCVYEEYSRNLSIVQHRALRGLLKNQLKAKNAEELFMQRRHDLRECWKASARKGKRLSNDVLRALGGLTLQTTLKAAQSEAEPSTVWTPPPAKLLVPDSYSSHDAMEESLETVFL
jgi:putative transposase